MYLYNMLCSLGYLCLCLCVLAQTQADNISLLFVLDFLIMYFIH